MNVTLYTRKGCHLCDVVYKTLVEHGLEPQIVDIDAIGVDIDVDESQRTEFDNCVPVVKIDGKIRFRGHVESLLLKRLLSGDA